MNKQYEVIWSKVKNSYVVVSELAKRNGKAGSTHRQSGQKIGVALSVLALCAGLTAGSALAATATNPAGEGPGIAIGNSSSASNNNAVAVGNNAQANSGNSIAVGNGSQSKSVNSIAVGTGAKAENSDAIAMGMNSSVTGADAIAIGKSSTSGANSIAIGQSSTPANNSIAIGKATISDSNGKKGSGDIAIGNGANINNYVDQSGSIAIGQNAKIENMSGKQEYLFSMGQTTFTKGNFWGTIQIPKDPSKEATGIAIGENTYARTGSLMVGSHNYRGLLGDVTVDSADTKAQGVNINSTTLGTNSYNGGAFATITGAYSIASSNYNGSGLAASVAKNFGATIMGSLNSIESATASNNSSGIANSIIGTANRTFNSNGSLVFGAGNEITNSITDISAPSSGGSSAKELQTNLMTSIRDSQSGGATLAIGGGNKADYTQKTSIIGVNNTVTGTSSDISQYNSVTGFNNTATNVDNVTIVGTNRTVSDASNTIVIGSADNDGITTTASDAVAIGHNTNVANDGGVALGSGSVSAIDKGIIGYDPSGKITNSATLASVVGEEQYNTLKNAVTSGTETVNTLTTDIASLKEEQSQYSRWSDEYSDLQDQIETKQTELESAETTLATNQLEYNKLVSTWESTGAAVSVGNSEIGLTRQITNVAAGSADTDAVNVAQLKATKVEVVAGKNISSVDTDTTAGYTKYTVNAIDTTVTDGSATYNADGTGTITLNTDSNGTKGTVTVTGLTDKYVDNVTFTDNTLTIKRNDDKTWAIENLATKGDVSGSATHYYSVNDGNYQTTNYDNKGAKGGMSLAAGAGSTANGTASSVVGAFSRIDGDGVGGMSAGFQGATAAAYGSFNVIGAKSGVAFDGVANSIIGVANKTENANAALVFGAGNKVTNSYRPVDMATAAPLANALQKAIATGDTDDMITALGGMVQTSGGGVLAIGGANTVDYALLSKVVGVGNTLTGTEGNESKLNMIDGFANTGTNVNNVTVIGSGNTVANTNGAIVVGDKRQLTNASNSVILGSADENMATSVADVTAIGHNANVTVANGVALGSGSVASVDKGQLGYNPSAKALTDDQKASATWTSTLAAVSVGDSEKKLTRQITNVAAGTADTDAVNVAQLRANKVTVVAGTNVTVDANTVADGSTTYTIASTDTYTTGGSYDATSKKITFTQNDTAKNYEVDLSGLVSGITEDIDKGLNFAGDSGDAINKKLDQTLDIVGGAQGDLTTGNIGVVSENGKLNVRLAKDLQDLKSVRIGGTTTNGQGIYIAKQSVNNSKGVDEEGNYITGLTNKTWNPTANGYVSGRAATEDQLNSVYETINQNITANKAVSGKNITVDENNKVNLNDNITFGGDTAANQVNINGNDAKVTAGDGANKVVVDGSKGQVTIGDTANGGIVMGNQTDVKGTKSDNTTDTQSGHFITGLDNTTWDPANKGVVADRAATEGQLKDIADKISDIDTAVKSTSRVFESDSGSDAQVTRKSTDPMKLKGGADANNLSDGNIGVVNNSDNTGFGIKLSKDIKNINTIEVNSSVKIGTGDNQTIIEGNTINTGSVTTGNTTINNGGLTIKNEDSSKNITIENNNISLGGNVIKNIGEGVDPKDAINKEQFDRTINNIGTGINQVNNRISKLDDRVNRVGAGAAALAALHPLEFSPEAKWEVSAGVGNYKNASAVALGAFYRPNGDTMFSVGTSLGGGENIINAGVTLRIGDGETQNYPSKKVMAQEITDLKTIVADQNERLADQNEKIEELTRLVNSLINNR